MIDVIISVNTYNDDFFKPLYDSLEDKQFLNQIFSFFMKLDINGFNPRDLPKIKSKEEVLDILKCLINNILNQQLIIWMRKEKTQRNIFMDIFGLQPIMDSL